MLLIYVITKTRYVTVSISFPL